VNPEVVKKYILEIRKVLGDNPDRPAFVQTFPKRGYQFVAPVTDEALPASLDSAAENSRNIVGREAALSGLDDLIKKALRGQRQVIFVTGEAGIGKTTLIDEFERRASKIPKLKFARGQCVEGFGGKEAYYPFFQAMGQLVRAPDSSAVVEALTKRAPTWMVQFPSLVKRQERDALQRDILGATRERMLREICEALEAITAENPHVLMLEDLHWGDPSTFDLISALARQRGPAKLVILGTYRPVDVALSKSPLRGLKQDLLVHRLCHEVALERLEETDVAEYLAAEFPGNNFPAALARLIYRHSGGNSLFMVAIVQDMMKKGVMASGGEAWSVTVPLQDFALDVPDTLQQLLEVQFDGLNAAEQRLLRNASIIGDRFTVGILSSMLGAELNQVEDTCEQLGRKQQFIRSAGLQDFRDRDTAVQYEFVHSLHRQVLYRQLSAANRTRLHKTLGGLLADDRVSEIPDVASQIALHFELGHEYARAVEYLLLTAEGATRKFAYRDAIQILEHALRLASKTSTTAELEIRILGRIGEANYALGKMMDAAEAYKSAAARASSSGMKEAEIEALNFLACTTVLIDGDSGIAVSQHASKTCQGLTNPLVNAQTQLLSATLRLGYDQWRMEDAAACVSAQQTIRRLSGPAHPSYHEVWYAHLQSLQGEYQHALDTAEAGMPKLNEPASLVAYVLALSSKAIALLHLGRMGEALTTLHTAQATGEKDSKTPWLFTFREAWLRSLVFDFEGVRGLCDMAMSANPTYLSGQPQAMALVASGYAALAEGANDKAMQCFRQLRDREAVPKFFLHWYWRMRGELGVADVYLHMGEVVDARREADRFLQSALSTADPNLQLLAWDLLTRVSMALNDLRSVKEFLQNAFAILVKFNVPVSAWRLHSTAWEFETRNQDQQAAERHRTEAQTGILALANSFAADEPLREIFLAAEPVRKVLNAGPLHNAILSAAAK
jgi:hypothetical protein